MHVHEAGTGPAVLFVHGFLGSCFSWRHQTASVAAAGFSVLAPDLPGFGESHSPCKDDHSHRAYARECASLVRQAGRGPAHVVGHSMGGTVVSWLAVEHPELVASLTLVAPSIFGAPLKMLVRAPGLPNLAYWYLTRRWSSRTRFARDLLRFYGAPVGDEVEADYWRRYQREENQRGAIAHLRDAGGPSVLPHLSKVRGPVHIIWGEQDQVFPVAQAHRLAAHLRGAQGAPKLTILSATGHFAMETESEVVNRALLSFLHGHAQPGTTA